MTMTEAPKRQGPSTKRLDQEAVKLATDWIEVRLEVRTRLIKMARANWPADLYRRALASGTNLYAPIVGTTVTGNTVRKLYQYPSDLTDATLLQLATTTPDGK